MSDSPDILRLRVLLTFLQDGESCTVMNIARTLGEEHYTVSRVLHALEEEGLVCREAPRRPRLTEKGLQEAQRYAERIRIAQNHLLYEGVGVEDAQNDAFHWALYNSDATMRVIREMEELYRVKYELRGQTQFSGAVICKKLSDGAYPFPFIIYREHVRGGSNISMANEGFEHPCHLLVKSGTGTVQLRAMTVTAKSAVSGRSMSGKVQTLKYFDSGSFISAEFRGDVISIPASCLSFRNMGSGVGQVLHGSLCLKMKCSVGIVHMPESTALFTVMI